LDDELLVNVPLHYVFESPTVMHIASIVDDMVAGAAPNAGTLSSPNLEPEVVLDEEIRPGAPYHDEWKPPSHIFLTGATGFLGAFLLHDLLQQGQAEIHCLVRAQDAAEGMRRIQQKLTEYGIWDPAQAHRVVPVPGDLTKPLLGLATQRFESLASKIDLI